MRSNLRHDISGLALRASRRLFYRERVRGGRHGRLVRSEKLSFSVRPPYVVGLLTSLPPFS